MYNYADDKLRVWVMNIYQPRHAYTFTPCSFGLVFGHHRNSSFCAMWTQIAKLMGPTWGPPGSCRPQMGPMLAPRTLLSGNIYSHLSIFVATCVQAYMYMLLRDTACVRDCVWCGYLNFTWLDMKNSIQSFGMNPQSPPPPPPPPPPHTATATPTPPPRDSCGLYHKSAGYSDFVCVQLFITGITHWSPDELFEH